ncbi:carboxypeptidase-like regulatory domain-containing protein [Lacinutrix sp. 5H-3-7-4]|uniref:carboxypeptidase-like regulatory domain-containing protein n=1 Tax=Lacinutrix sp. (strain 5H-3-7-4) TaxID=983544 RepID=UPI00020A3995|nr:carboxypeptidase-like regulatory domain-containing protein [Lacinutrix sp. 5H-3-7-4]AEH00945.1 hypothetical protein Lacal_1097 [Lacinutrix sp. 5H-3-7-4]
MGSKKHRKLTFITKIVVFFFLQNFCFSQAIIFGTVKDSTSNIASASVILKDSLSQSILSFAYTGKNGNYSLTTDNLGKFNLVFTSLGYEVKTVPITVKNLQENKEVNATLKIKPMSLDEVVIKSERAISIKKDTITFKTKFFVNGTEQTVEDLLKTIPGINIGTDGAIKIGNQEIEKLMIDGDDLFEKGYKILSKNMPAYPIEEVELLKNYSNNRLLKNIEESNKVALNLKLNEKSKSIWFGNIKAGLGNENFYEFKGNLMNFGKKNKYYFFTNFNNIGYDATGDINNLIKPFKVNEPSSVGDNQSVNTLINLVPDRLSFKKNRTNFNNAELTSLNAIFNPSKKIKIKTLGFFNWDEKDFFKNTIEVVNTNDANFTNIENHMYRSKSKIAFGKVNVIYNLSKNKMLEGITKYNTGSFNTNTNLLFNGNSTIENLRNTNRLFDQKINFTNKFKKNKAFLITGRFIDEKEPENYTVNQFFFQDLFPNNDGNNIEQQNLNEMQFVGVNAHLLDRKTNGDLLEIQIGNEFRKDKLISNFSIKQNNTLLSSPVGYQNSTIYHVNDLYVKSKYLLKVNNFGFIGKLNAHQLFNRLENKITLTKQNPFYINPSIGVNWKINNNNKITSTYSYNTTNTGIIDVYNNYVLNDFRSFSKGTSNINQLISSSVFLNYQLGNWSDRFFANTFILYSKNHDFFSTNSLLNQNVTQSERIIIKDREFLNFNSKLDFYIKQISSNLKLDLGFTKNEFKNIINNSNLRKVTTNNYNYGLELRSGFKGFFNYHIGTKWTTSKVKTNKNNSFTNNMSFLDLTFVLKKKFDATLKTESYYLGSLQSDKAYYFLDFNTRYKLIKDKLTLSLNGKNIFNTKFFRNFSISDIGTSAAEYRLIPRYILLKMEYRF